MSRIASTNPGCRDVGPDRAPSRIPWAPHTALLLGLCVLSCVLSCVLFVQTAGAQSILVFSKTEGFRHSSIADGLTAIESLGIANGFSVDATENGADFNAANLAAYDAVVFLSTTGDVLDASQEAAFEDFVAAGGGWVGVHAAADCEYGWDWYGGLLGGDAWFQNHPAIQDATLDNVAPTAASTSHYPARFSFRDEWYNFQNDPTPFVDVLLTIDETTYSGGSMGSGHPISWSHAYAGGRAWYTAMGHRSQTFEDPDFQLHLLGGIEYAVPEPAFGGSVLLAAAGLLLAGAKGRIRAFE